MLSVVCFLLTFFSIRGLESEKLFSDPSKLDSKNRTSEKNQNQKGFYESVNEIWKENSQRKICLNKGGKNGTWWNGNGIDTNHSFRRGDCFV